MQVDEFNLAEGAEKLRKLRILTVHIRKCQHGTANALFRSVILRTPLSEAKQLAAQEIHLVCT